MKKLISFLIIPVFSLSITSCKKDHMLDCFKSAGEEVTESREATGFTDIQLDDNVDLIIHPDTSPYIKVTAGKNLIDGIITEQSGQTLYIRNENRCNWVRSFKNKYTVEVGMDKPSHIVYFGEGDIHCIDTIRSPEFHFDCTNGSGSINLIFNCPKIHINNHTGRTDIHLSGKTQETYIYINDVATLESTALESDWAYITNRSTGDIRTFVRNELGVEIWYNGNIYYTGNPVISASKITGSGRLIHF